MTDEYSPSHFVLDIKTLSHVKGPGYMLETSFSDRSFRHKPEKAGVGTPALFFKGATNEFVFRPSGIVCFLLSQDHHGRRTRLARAELDLSELAGELAPIIEREIPMDWEDTSQRGPRPRLSFKLHLKPEPPANLRRSVWEPTPSTNRLLETSNADRSLFPSDPSSYTPGGLPPTASLWAGLIDETNQSIMPPPLPRPDPQPTRPAGAHAVLGGHQQSNNRQQHRHSPSNNLHSQESPVGRLHPMNRHAPLPYYGAQPDPRHMNPMYPGMGPQAGYPGVAPHDYPPYPGAPGTTPRLPYRAPYPYQAYPQLGQQSGGYPTPQVVVPNPATNGNPYKNVYEEGRRSGMLQSLVRRLTRGHEASPRAVNSPLNTDSTENNDPRLSQQTVQSFHFRR